MALMEGGRQFSTALVSNNSHPTDKGVDKGGAAFWGVRDPRPSPSL